MATNLLSPNGATPPAIKGALTSRDAWKTRIVKTRPIVAVHIEELDDPDDAEQPEGWVYMQAMTGSNKEAWGLRRIDQERYEPDPELAKQYDREKTWGEMLKGNKLSLVAYSVVDEHGGLLWTEHDVAELGEMNAAALERLYAKAVQLNGLGRGNIPDYLVKWLEADESAARGPQTPLDVRVKNSNAGRSDNSSTS